MSTGEKLVPLLVGGSPSIDATIQTSTEKSDYGRSYKWSVTAKKIGTDGNPIVHIEASNNGVDWVRPYVDVDGNEIIWTLDDATNNSIFDEVFPFDQFRLTTEPNGNTTGTVEYELCLHF